MENLNIISRKMDNTKLKLSDLNPHLMCVLCGGYYIDATTIVECLHSFCRSCIVKHLESSKYCPICEVQVHKTKPLINIRPDKTLQDIVYKLVPGLFSSEMRNRRLFYKERPHYIKPNDSESAGEVFGERKIYVNDENITFSLVYHKKSRPTTLDESFKEIDTPFEDKLKYFKCPTGVTIHHLTKLIKAKFSLSESNYKVEIYYKDQILFEDFTLLDVSYIYLWKDRGTLDLSYKIFESIVKRQKLEDENEFEFEDWQKELQILGRTCLKLDEAKKKPKGTNSIQKVKAKKEKNERTAQSKVVGVTQLGSTKNVKTSKSEVRLAKENGVNGSEVKEVQLQISESGVISVSEVEDGELIRTVEEAAPNVTGKEANTGLNTNKKVEVKEEVRKQPETINRVKSQVHSDPQSAFLSQRVAHPQTQLKPHSQSKPRPEIQTQSRVQSQLTSQSQSLSPSQSQFYAKNQSNPQNFSQTLSKTQSKSQSQSRLQSEPSNQAQSQNSKSIPPKLSSPTSKTQSQSLSQPQSLSRSQSQSPSLSKSKQQTLPQQQPSSQAQSMAHTQLQSQSRMQSQSQPHSLSQTQSLVQSEVQPQSKTQTQLQIQSHAPFEGKPKSQIQSQTLPQSQPQSQPHPQPHPQPQPKPQPQSQSQSQPQIQPLPQSQSQPQSQTQPKLPAQLDSQPQSQSQSETQSQPHLQTSSKLQPSLQSVPPEKKMRKIYKTIHCSPKAWHPVIPKEKLRPTLMKNSDEPKKPPKFFKMRNMPRFLGNPSSGVKPMYAENSTEEKNKEKTEEAKPETTKSSNKILKIDPKTLRPIEKEEMKVTPNSPNLLTNPFIPNNNHFLFSNLQLLPPNSGNYSNPGNPETLKIEKSTASGVKSPTPNGTYPPIRFPTPDPSAGFYPFSNLTKPPDFSFPAADKMDPLLRASRLSPFGNIQTFNVAGFHASLPPSISRLLNPQHHFRKISQPVEKKNKEESTKDASKNCDGSLKANTLEEKEKEKGETKEKKKLSDKIECNEKNKTTDDKESIKAEKPVSEKSETAIEKKKEVNGETIENASSAEIKNNIDVEDLNSAEKDKGKEKDKVEEKELDKNKKENKKKDEDENKNENKCKDENKDR